MQEIYVEDIRKILINKKKLEKELDVKITNKGKNVFIDGEADKEYTSLEVLRAINTSFSVDKALILKEDGMSLQILYIRDITRRNDLDTVRGRIIGTQGKTLNTLKKLTGCEIVVHDNNIGIIGSAENIEYCVQAITSLIRGSKQGNVYARLEKEKKKRKQYDDEEFIGFED